MSTLRGTPVTLGAAAAIATTGLTTAPAARASTPVQMCQAGVANHQTDYPSGAFGNAALCLYALVYDAGQDKIQRNAFISGLTNDLTTLWGGRYNVVIFNTSEGGISAAAPGQPYSGTLNNVVARVPLIDYGANQTAEYTLWVFTGPGTFTDEGDRGWLNWGFGGHNATKITGAGGHSVAYFDAQHTPATRCS
jgi:hypothetical protein